MSTRSLTHNSPAGNCGDPHFRGFVTPADPVSEMVHGCWIPHAGWGPQHCLGSAGSQRRSPWITRQWKTRRNVGLIWLWALIHSLIHVTLRSIGIVIVRRKIASEVRRNKFIPSCDADNRTRYLRRGTRHRGTSRGQCVFVSSGRVRQGSSQRSGSQTRMGSTFVSNSRCLHQVPRGSARTDRRFTSAEPRVRIRKGFDFG